MKAIFVNEDTDLTNYDTSDFYLQPSDNSPNHMQLRVWHDGNYGSATLVFDQELIDTINNSFDDDTLVSKVMNELSTVLGADVEGYSPDIAIHSDGDGFCT